MNSIHRIGVTIAGLATVATVGGAFVAQGYMTAQKAAADATAQTSAQTSATSDPTADPTATLDPEIIYVNPVPSPAVIHVTKPARPVHTKAPVVPVVVPTLTPTGEPGEPGDNGGSDD
jgi:hypothetical protein